MTSATFEYPRRRKRGDRSPLTIDELEAMWRPSPAFIGPVGPPEHMRLRAERRRAENSR